MSFFLAMPLSFALQRLEHPQLHEVSRVMTLDHAFQNRTLNDTPFLFWMPLLVVHFLFINEGYNRQHVE